MFSEGINKHARPLVYRAFDEEEPLSCSDSKFKEQFAEVHAEVVACRFPISAKQFSHRLVPAYLANTKIVGIDSLQSVQHWIGLISLWISGKALFLPHNISKKNLEELLQFLVEYKNALERVHATSVGTCRESAKKALQEIQTGLGRRDTFYTPLSYTQSSTGCGHAIPLKLRNKGKQVEALFLNLGAGIRMHPIVDWSPSGPRYHFQSFPVLIDKTRLASSAGEEVFTRLIRMGVEACLVKVRGYSAEDVYGPIYSLGTIQSSFSSKVDERSRKPQLGDICGDMAILLIIKDALIDFGYKKNELQRLVTLEKLCDILFFYHSLCSKESPLDEWILLKNGLKEFSVRVLKEKESVLSLAEIEFLHTLLHPLFSHTTEQINKLKRVLLPITPLYELQNSSIVRVMPVQKTFYLPAQEEKLQTIKTTTPSITSRTPAEIGIILKEWATVAEELVQKKEEIKAHHFVYRALCSLEIPHPDLEKKEFWDQVPDTEITEILNSLALLTCHGIDKNLSEDEGLIYRNTLIVSIAYAIADRLARRKFPELKGFASPFYPSRFILAYTSNAIGSGGEREIYQREKYFEFWNLPLERANTIWSQVRIYFERQLAVSEHTLFALSEPNIDIAQGIKAFHARRFENRAWTPVQDHLKFLENFLERTFPRSSTLSLEERYKKLWMNPHHCNIPSEIETLYFFAYHAWHSFCNNPTTLLPDSTQQLPARVHREESKEKCGIEVKQPLALKSVKIQALLGREGPFTESLWKTSHQYSENETQCFTYSGSDPRWNTQLTRQWHRIFWKRSLQISSLIQWMRSNLSLVCQSEIQQLIEVALFMPGVLIAKIQEEPATLIQLRELIREAVAYYSKSSLENPTSLFLMRLGIVIESYASKPLLEVYEARLLEGIRGSLNPSTLYYHLLLLYQIDLPRGTYSVRELIKAQFWMAYHEVDSSEVPAWIVAETGSPLERYHKVTSKCFQEQEWLEQTFEEVFALVLDPNKLPTVTCIGEYPLLMRGLYRFDVEKGKIDAMRGEPPKSPFCPLIYINKKHWAHFPALEEAKGLVWSDYQGHFTCESEQNKIVVKDTACHIAQKFPHLKKSGFSRTWYEKGGIAPNASDSILFDSAEYDHWSTKYSIVICKKGENQPLYFVINPATVDCFVHKVLPDGTLGPILVFLGKNHPLTPWFARLGDNREVCVWINEATGYIEEIDFLVLGLTFQEEEGRFYCKNYPGFFLAEDQSLEELNFFEGALVLEDGKEKIVLIPARKLEQQGENFSTHINFKKEFLSINEKYFLYHLDEIAGLLVHPTSVGNLFLSLMFAMQMNYNQALFYLARSRSFSSPKEPFEWLLLFFTRFKDQSPEALGFYLRLGLHIIHSSQQVILSAYDKKERHTEEEVTHLCKWLGEKFAQYLNIHSIKEISRIPEEIRLSRDEELFLFEFLENKLKEVDKKAALEAKKREESPKTCWPRLFDIRLSLLQKKTWSAQISPKSYKLFIANHLFSTKVWDLKVLLKQCPPHLAQFSKVKLACSEFQDFVRLTQSNIRIYFMILYERARTSQAEIDLFYLARGNEEGFCFEAVYHLLLSYVHRHPDTFQDLVFGEDPFQNANIFQEILDRADGIYMNLWRSAFNVQKSFLEDSISFRYQKSIMLSLETPPILAPLAWNISESKIGVLQELQRSILSYFQEYWFETSSNHGKTIYKLKEGKEVQECLCEAKKWLDAKRSEGLCLKKTAEAIANKYPEKDYFFGLRKMSSNLPEITMEGILTQAYQERNALKIKEANPSLKPLLIKELIFHTIHYHILRLQIYKLERAIERLEKGGSIEEFAECLVFHGTFNPAENPEIFLYQSRTGKTLRKGQAELLVWELATTVEKIPKVRLFAAPAGEGKTTLYIPIAMKRFQRLGYVPFSFSSKPLYLVDREGLKETSQHVYSLELAVCEIALNSEAKAADYKWIYEQLSQQGGKKGFKLVPDAFYALHLKYQLALENGDCESVRWLSQIFAFWKKKGIAMIDESRLNCSPFTQSKIGIGKPTSLPEIDRVVFLEIYRFLIDETLQLSNNRSVKETVGLQKNQQATMSSKEREEVKKVVLAALVKSPLFRITSTHQSKLYAYWMNRSDEVGLEGTEVEQRRAIDLVKIYFEEFFDKAMQLIWGMQHVRSIRPGEELHVPARARQATLAYFEEAYVTLIATIHGFLQQGLDGEQVKKLIVAVEHRIIEEAGLSGNVSDTERMLTKWAGKEPHSLNRISISQLSEDRDFYMRVHKNPEVIFWYLERVVLKQIQSSPQQLIVTPVHMQNGFCSTTFFSADTGPKQIYGIYEDGQHVRTNSTFLERVEQQFLSPKNSQFLTLPFLTRPLDCFHALLAQDPTLFSHLRMICDAGGTLRNFTVEEIVSDFFTLLQTENQIDLDGVIIFEEASDKESETELLLWLKTWKAPQVIKGHDVPKALQALGLNWETLKLLTFIDPSHRAGANIEQPKGSSTLILLGEGLTFSDLAQGALRDRGFLTGEKRLIWAAEKRLVQLISDQISIPKVLTWTKSNGTKVADQEVFFSTYQQIDYHIALPVWNAIEKYLEDPQAQIDLWRQYEKGLVMPTKIDPIKRFKRKQKPQSLLEYAEEKYNSFGFSTPWKKATSLHIKLRPFIARQSHMLSPSSLDVMRHTHVHTHQKEEMRKEFIANAHSDLIAEVGAPLPDWLTINYKDFVTQLCAYSREASQVFNSTGLTSGLWFTNNALRTAKSGLQSLEEGYLKPTQYILVIKQNGKWVAFALADEEAFVFQKQMNSVDTPLFQKCALLGGDGFLVQNGKKKCRFSQEELHTNFIQDVVIDVSLTRCELMNPLRFMKRIPTWHDFWPMWLKIKKSQPFPHSTLMVEKHIPPHIRNYVPPPAPSFTDSLFKSIFS